MATLVRVGFLSRLAGLGAAMVSYVINWSRTDVYFNNTTNKFNDSTQ